ncbi:MAG: ester cyclase [SAR202 cluster bacterium]|nr:ester cyclase [SAR202 cluster bacterium]
MSEQNKALIRRLIKDLDQRHEPPDEYYAPNCKVYFNGEPPMDFQAYKKASKGFYAAFPDLVHHIDELIAEGNNVVMRQHVTATNKGTFQGVPATGKQVTYTGIIIWRITNGKVSEFYSNFDLLALYKGVGGVKMLTKE